MKYPRKWNEQFAEKGERTMLIKTNKGEGGETNKNE